MNVQGSIIKDWGTTTLAEVCTFENGDRGVNYPSPGSFVSSGKPFVNAGHLNAGRIDFKDMDFITEETFSRLGGGKFGVGDILFCLRGSLGKFGVVQPRTPAGAIASSLVILRSKTRMLSTGFLACFLASEYCAQQIEKWSGGAAQPNLGAKELARFNILLPPVEEQMKVTRAITDADDLIATLGKFIVKKQAIKQGMMQQLLTGKTRLPGFTDEWNERLLGEVARIKTGLRNNQDKKAGGRYPFFVRSAVVERIDSYSYDCEAILVPGEGGIGSIFHHVDGKFEVHQRVYKISDFALSANGRFIYHFMRQYFGAHAMQNSVKATVDSLRLPTFKNFEIRMPSLDEQQAIVRALDDAEAEVASLKRRLTKARATKAGMTQELLTGRTRLPIEGVSI